MLALLPFALLLAAADAPAPAPGPGDFGAPRLAIPAPAELERRHLGWPKVVRHKDALYVFCLAGEAHTRKGSPVVYVSRNGGSSFEGPRVLRAFGEGEWSHSGNLAAGVAADGALVVLAMAMDANSSRTAIFGWRSRDGGATWREVDTSALSGEAGSVYGYVFPVPGRGLAVTGHFRKGATGGERGAWIAFSRDNGQSWGKAAAVTSGPHVEPCILYTAGKLVGLIRTNPMDRYIQVVSDDLGRSWRQSDAMIDADAALPSPFLAADPRDPKRLWALQSDRNPKGVGDGKGRIRLWSARLDTLDWRPEGVVATFPSRTQFPKGDYTYPWMTPLGGRDWFVVFYGGLGDGPNSIWGLKLRTPR